METKSKQEETRQSVREGYAAIATADAQAGGCCGPAGGCGVRTDAEQLAQQIGYSAAEIAALPEGSNLGLSCGNPGAIATLQPCETVLDLGSGAGFDCFLMGPKVGPRGRVIGVDMTHEMLARARRNLVPYTARTGLANIEFRLGEIEHLPVADASVDCVISNCVLNLSPDKPQVWREIARVLKPAGRVAISDLVLLRDLPQAVKADVEALVGCVAGAVTVAEIEQMARAAGLVAVRIEPKPEYVAAMENAADPLYARIAAALPAGAKIGDYVASADIRARKLGSKPSCC